MKQLNESIPDLLKNAAFMAGMTQDEGLAAAAMEALDASVGEGVIGANDLRVYEAIMQGMVMSGALKVPGQEVISSGMPIWDWTCPVFVESV